MEVAVANRGLADRVRALGGVHAVDAVPLMGRLPTTLLWVVAMVAMVPVMAAIVGIIVGWNIRGLTERLQAGRGSGPVTPARGHGGLPTSSAGPVGSSLGPLAAEPRSVEHTAALIVEQIRKHSVQPRGLCPCSRCERQRLQDALWFN